MPIIERLSPNVRPIIMTKLWANSCSRWPMLRDSMLRMWWKMTGVDGRRDLIGVK